VKRRGYTGTAYVPHDAKVPNFETGRTRIETMLAEGFRPQVIPDHSVEDRINAAKLTLARTIFNGDTCASGLEALRQYRQEWDDKARVFKNTPKHDWASHPADSWGYLAMAWREFIAPRPPDAAPRLKGLNEMTIDEFIAAESGGPERADRV
jgi:phage terminase large subunit